MRRNGVSNPPPHFCNVGHPSGGLFSKRPWKYIAKLNRLDYQIMPQTRFFKYKLFPPYTAESYNWLTMNKANPKGKSIIVLALNTPTDEIKPSWVAYEY